jgi:hypothetical protein
MSNDSWPALPYGEWAPTKKTLQMYSQMLGKLRLALAPPQPEWLNACLFLDARGFTTGPMPYEERVVTARIDLFDLVMILESSDGRREQIGIADRCVSDVWSDFQARIAALGLRVPFSEKPQETSDTTHFSENRHDCVLDADDAQRFHRLLCTLDGVYEEFRSKFFGRTGVQFWWGAFDFAVLLFTGNKLDAPDDKGYIMRYDLDAEHLNAGFWPGDDTSPEPVFYGYLVPRPDGCDVAPMEPAHASWVEAMEEWVLPYEAVRTSPEPRKAVLDFLESVYQVAVTQSGWDAAAFEYTKPPTKRA